VADLTGGLAAIGNSARWGGFGRGVSDTGSLVKTVKIEF